MVGLGKEGWRNIGKWGPKYVSSRLNKCAIDLNKVNG